MMEELAKFADGKTTIRMIEYLNRTTLDVIGMVFGCYLLKLNCALVFFSEDDMI